MKKSVCIIDDEFLSRERIRTLLSDEVEYYVAGEADNGRSAVELIDSIKPDLVILDIKMPGFSGFQVLQETIHKPSVIFVTAYNEHAVEAFEVNAVDYLLKPFPDKRFKDALARVPLGESLGGDTLNTLRYLIEGSIQKKTYLERITVKDRFEFIVISVEDIDYFSIESGLVFYSQQWPQICN